MSDKLPGWRDIPIGGMILEAGNSAKYETGTWRSSKPIWDPDKCIQCLQCWVYCPDSSIMVKDEKVCGIDYFHCKGCGLCASVCPAKVQAITMEIEET